MRIVAKFMLVVALFAFGFPSMPASAQETPTTVTQSTAGGTDDRATSGGDTATDTANPADGDTRNNWGLFGAIGVAALVIAAALVIGAIRKRKPNSLLNNNNSRPGR